MAGRSTRPRALKGALVIAANRRPPEAIAFQYNPHTLSRQLSARTYESRRGPARLAGAPEQTISLEVAIDAADQLERSEPRATEMGIHPQLAALEMLLYPSSAHVRSTAQLANAGTIEVVPPPAPMVLFVWGKRRVLPVEISEFSVTEEAYDKDLNPIRARVSLGLRVLTYSDLSQSHPGYHLFVSHQIVQETMAGVARANTLAGQGVDRFISGGG